MEAERHPLGQVDGGDRLDAQDFRNSAQDITDAFAPFYEHAEAIPTDPNLLFDASRELGDIDVIRQDDVDAFAKALAKGGKTAHEKTEAALNPAVEGTLSRDDFAQAVRWVESYVFRRAVCAIPTNSLNKTFANFSKTLDKNRFLESMQAQFLLLPSYRRFPGDDEFRRELKQRDLYNFRSRSYWLRRLENVGRKERVPVDEYTIEHIMPQNADLPSEWRSALGDEWERIHETLLHTLGNLTLTGYNSEYSDHPFAKKRDMRGGFRESPLRLNDGLGQTELWTEAEIHARAERLSRQAAEVWPSPKLPTDVLELYRPKKTSVPSAVYGIDDHKHLAEGKPARKLFDALRQHLIDIDPCVTEEFLKLYVAYKAETNFVDIVAQAERLRISINLDFHELHDPRKLAKDVTGMGRWGNGNVEVKFDSLDDIPYIMGLARQGFERQMGNGTEDG